MRAPNTAAPASIAIPKPACAVCGKPSASRGGSRRLPTSSPKPGRSDRSFSAPSSIIWSPRGLRPRRWRKTTLACRSRTPGSLAARSPILPRRIAARSPIRAHPFFERTGRTSMRAILLALALGVAAPAVTAQQGPVPIFGLVELSGTGTTSGTNFDNGIKLAVKEINASGGILGRKIEYTSLDTQSQPQIAKALAQKAIDQGAYVVMGPVFSGSILVSMEETRRAEVPNFTGGEAAAITQKGDPYIFRTSFTQTTAMPKVARYLKDTVKAKNIAIIWVNNDFGKGGLDTLRPALDAQGIRIAAEISTDPGQLDFSGAVLKAKQANADALFVYTNEEEAARALRELRKQGYDRPIVGETVLTSQKVIE